MTMLQRLKPAVAAAAMLLIVSHAVAFAEGPATTGAPAAEPTPVLISAPVPAADGSITLEGVIEYQELEGGFYSVNGWGLIGNEALIKSRVGNRVIVRGKEFTGMSTTMVKQIELSQMLQPLSANRALPGALRVSGKTAAYDVAPFVQDGALMLPLRAVVEAAGGAVEWDGRTHTVTVTMPDRMAYVALGQGEAEMNENNVRYIQRNMIKMAKIVVAKDGRTFISADAVSTILGLAENVQFGTGLDLVSMK